MSEAAKQAGELESLVGTTLAGRYRVDSLLGVGGMGAVFQAHHLLLKRDVAVKVLHPELVSNEDISKRFDREAQSAARLDHPNIIPVTEFGSTDAGMKYMVMQLLSGRELTELLGEALDPIRAIELELQILRGLEHAHANGVIHRDLKPENVFVTVDHEQAEILKLVDFGIAKLIDEGEGEDAQPLTRMGLVFGTPQYMSPEQATGSEIDPRTDIYSAGVILYHMLAGQVPFDHEDPVSLIRMQVSLDPPALPASVPESLVQVVSVMMAKSRDNRYPDARSARKALQAVQAQIANDRGVPIAFNPEDTGIVDPRDIYGSGGVPTGGVPAVGAAATQLPGQLSGQHSGQLSGQHSGQLSGQAFGSPSTMASVAPAAPAPRGPGASPVDKVLAKVTEFTTFARPHVESFIETVKGDPRKWGAIGGGVLLSLILLVAIWPEGDDDEPEGGDAQAATGADKPPDTKVGEGPLIDTDVIDEDTLVAIDQALTGKDEDAALALIRPALDKNPENAQLLWREGKARAMKRAKSSQVTALERYAAAFESDPKLIENPDFYGELGDLLRNPKLREQAIDLTVQKLGENGHTFLLELVNIDNPKQVLGWVDRHRVLNELATSEDSLKRVDQRLNLARDLYQASDAPDPCAAFGEALGSMAAAKDSYYIEHVFNTKLEPPTAEDSETSQGTACQGLSAKLTGTRAGYRLSFPEDTAKYPTSAGPKKKKKR